jgi:hypothetical protein
MTENTSTVPVRAADLRVGDVVKWRDGRYCVVESLPEPNHFATEYAEPLVAFWATENECGRPPGASRYRRYGVCRPLGRPGHDRVRDELRLRRRRVLAQVNVRLLVRRLGAQGESGKLAASWPARSYAVDGIAASPGGIKLADRAAIDGAIMAHEVQRWDQQRREMERDARDDGPCCLVSATHWHGRPKTTCVVCVMSQPRQARRSRIIGAQLPDLARRRRRGRAGSPGLSRR